ncbi:hypothetical protein SOASR032_00760 [Pragia fontium]|uniref:Uncharacterized protein n=1 Tax=Pragia fontium TaxID=82985 RepID=A0ABQ5LFE8_9GAMM|nr:hypothetical protein SOASR032_00760 [Pragia fontium]VEJ55592.1 Uncharacterised protein [Pragia fontium]
MADLGHYNHAAYISFVQFNPLRPYLYSYYRIKLDKYPALFNLFDLCITKGQLFGYSPTR